MRAAFGCTWTVSTVPRALSRINPVLMRIGKRESEETHGLAKFLETFDE